MSAYSSRFCLGLFFCDFLALPLDVVVLGLLLRDVMLLFVLTGLCLLNKCDNPSLHDNGFLLWSYCLITESFR